MYFDYQPILGRRSLRGRRKQCWITPQPGSLVGGRPVAEYWVLKPEDPAAQQLYCVTLYFIPWYTKLPDGNWMKHKHWKTTPHDPQEFIEWCVRHMRIEL